MSHPSDADDGWADLYRELGVESRPPTNPPTHLPAAAGADEEFGVLEGDRPDGRFDPGAVVGEESDPPAELEAGDDAGEDESEEAGVVEGEPGGDQPKKRRRRRRRRRKGGPDGTEGGAEGPAAEGQVEGEAADDAPEGEEAVYAAPAAVDEGLAPESGRELIANWNVPSWPEIVAGLHRPDR
jgi:hypothetical protein